jgi:MFS family permease
MMLAMIAGPLLGGYITDSRSWRWIFYINSKLADVLPADQGGSVSVLPDSTCHAG